MIGSRNSWRALALTLIVLPLPFLAGFEAQGWWRAETFAWDLDVYLQAAQRLLDGAPLYPVPAPPLPMIYPPVAAVAAVPLAWVGTPAAGVLWTLINVCLVVAVFFRVGVTGWRAPVLAAAAIALGGPLAQVFALGQVGIALMAMCILDLAPGSTLIARASRRLPWPMPQRLLPVGTLVGLAAAIKLTPALFIVVLVLIGRRRPAIAATASLIIATMIGFLVRPADSWAYFSSIATGDLPGAADSAYQVTNQSLLAVASRAMRVPELPLLVTLVGGLFVVAVTIGSAWALHRRGEPLLAILAVGLGSTVAAPISWTHAYTWAAPLAVAALLRPVSLTVRLIAVGLWGWVTFEPFQVVNTDTDVGLRLGPAAQVASAVTPVLAIVLLLVFVWWARDRRPASAVG